MNTRIPHIIPPALILAAVSAAGAQLPIGFERFTNPDASSGVDFGLTEIQIFNKYAMPLPAGGLPLPPEKDLRLIDIEIRSDQDFSGIVVYDVVWVKNEGAFKRSSWFLPDLSAGAVTAIARWRDTVILDIERFPRGNDWRFSVILQENPGGFAWNVFLDVELQDLMDAVSATGSRLIDIDVDGDLCAPSVPEGQACGLSIVDAVMVENSGANYVPTANALLLTPGQYPDIMDTGYQIVDQESTGWDHYLTIWVKSDQPFLPFYDQTQNETVFNQGHKGRVVDLEASRPVQPPLYDTINLP